MLYCMLGKLTQRIMSRLSKNLSSVSVCWQFEILVDMISHNNPAASFLEVARLLQAEEESSTFMDASSLSPFEFLTEGILLERVL